MPSKGGWTRFWVFNVDNPITEAIVIGTPEEDGGSCPPPERGCVELRMKVGSGLDLYDAVHIRRDPEGRYELCAWIGRMRDDLERVRDAALAIPLPEEVL